MQDLLKDAGVTPEIALAVVLGVAMLKAMIEVQLKDPSTPIALSASTRVFIGWMVVVATFIGAVGLFVAALLLTQNEVFMWVGGGFIVLALAFHFGLKAYAKAHPN